jgi:hypothetical protein
MNKGRRVQLTVPPELVGPLTFYAESVRRPLATAIIEFLAESAPALEAMGKFARLHRSGKKAAASKALRELVGDQMAEVIKEVRDR